MLMPKVHVSPNFASTTPAIAGPTLRAAGKVTELIRDAVGRYSVGTSRGINARWVVYWMPEPKPPTANRATIGPGRRLSVSDSTNNEADEISWIMLAIESNRRRSNRSDQVPASGAMITDGPMPAATLRPTHALDPVRSCRMNGTVTLCMKLPAWDTTEVIQNVRKSLTLNTWRTVVGPGSCTTPVYHPPVDAERSSGPAIARSTARGIAVRAFFVAVVAVAVGLLVRGYHDPHRLFAFQPFNASDEWRVDLYRDVDGVLVPVEGGAWVGYRWNALVPAQLQGLGRLHHASGGADNTIDFLDDALDWVADHTPRDTETDRLVAEVTWFHNTRGPYSTTLSSAQREEGA